MRIAGKIKDFSTSHITLEIDGDIKTTDKLQKLGNELVVIEVNKWHDKRSKSANNYFWELVSQIAEKLGTDRQAIYQWMLRDAGVMVSLMVVEDAIPRLNDTFRLIEEIGRRTINGQTMVEVNCYYGSSMYDSKEMAHLIEITRQEAVKLGCDVWSDDEVKQWLN